LRKRDEIEEVMHALSAWLKINSDLVVKDILKANPNLNPETIREVITRIEDFENILTWVFNPLKISEYERVMREMMEKYNLIIELNPLNTSLNLMDNLPNSLLP